MSIQDDRDDLERARKAVASAETAAVETDGVIAALHKTTAEIVSLTQPNGYVNRFRKVVRGT